MKGNVVYIVPKKEWQNLRDQKKRASDSIELAEGFLRHRKLELDTRERWLNVQKKTLRVGFMLLVALSALTLVLLVWAWRTLEAHSKQVLEEARNEQKDDPR